MYIYYPSNAAVYVRQVGGPDRVTEQWIGAGPDSVIIISGSYPPTASTAFITASYATTSSFALNGGGGGSTSIPYTVIITGSLNWITCSFLSAEQYINIPVSASYNFTHSDVPAAGLVSSVILYMNNTATFTSSLSFPSTWKFLGIIPTYLTTSKVSVLSLKGYGDGTVLASMTSQY